MVFTKEDRILIKVLRQSKGYSARKLLEEFPDKDWSRSALDRLLRQIDAATGLQTGSPAAADDIRSARETTVTTLNCSLSAKKMRRELTEPYVRSLGKPVSRRRWCTESFKRT